MQLSMLVRYQIFGENFHNHFQGNKYYFCEILVKHCVAALLLQLMPSLKLLITVFDRTGVQVVPLRVWGCAVLLGFTVQPEHFVTCYVEFFISVSNLKHDTHTTQN